MKFLTAVATVVVVYSGAAMAQMQGDKPETTPPDMKIVTGNETKHARHADARHCLDLKTDLQIIRCAEKYLYTQAAARNDR
jgi:hypothetical protein